MKRSSYSEIIYKGKEKAKIKELNDIIVALHENATAIYIGNIELTKEQVKNLLAFYTKLDPKTAERVLKASSSNFTQIKF